MKEFRDDFETGAQAYDGTSTSKRPDAVSIDFLTAWSAGPVQRSDGSEGPYRRVWRARVDNENGDMYLQRSEANIGEPPQGWRPESVLFSFSGEIDEIDLAFDQNGNAMICAQRFGSEVWLYWFNPLASTFVFEKLADGRTPRILLDDPFNSSESDVLVFYINDAEDRVEFRMQRELFAAPNPVSMDLWVDYETREGAGVPNIEDFYLQEVARSTDRRLHIYAAMRNPGTGRYRYLVLESAPYPTIAIESVRLATVIGDLTSTIVVLVAENIESLELSQSIAELMVQELVLNINTGEDDNAFLISDNARLSPVIEDLDVVELVLYVNNQDPENVRLSPEVQDLETVVTVITALHQDPENLRLSPTIQSLTVSPA